MKNILIILGSPNSAKGRLGKAAIGRLKKCIEIFQTDENLILCTGGFGVHFNTSQKPHAEYLMRYLTKKGIPKKYFLPFADSANTVEDAVKTKAILEKIELSNCTIITSNYHLKRVQLIFDEILVGIEKRYIGVEDNFSEKKLTLLQNHEAKAIEGILKNGLYY
jgi:uncharacterized SAM-binding protein YcdF (DUF218 family)